MVRSENVCDFVEHKGQRQQGYMNFATRGRQRQIMATADLRSLDVSTRADFESGVRRWALGALIFLSFGSHGFA